MTLYIALVVGIAVVTVSQGMLGYIALRLFRSSVEIAVTFATAHGKTLDALQRIHDRNMEQLAEMADRFMSLDFTTFKAYQMAASAEEGGIEAPGEGEVRVERITATGNVIPIGADLERRLAAAAEEEKILAEDFPDGWDEGAGNS